MVEFPFLMGRKRNEAVHPLAAGKCGIGELPSYEYEVLRRQVKWVDFF